jgi:RNA polymerase sigma factor (sigma-70 family)
MPDDSELLRRYADDHSEEAFGELVRRHLGLVYNAALRQCGDPHLAEDAAQNVFSDLARKARPLSSRPVLAGWLYTSARFAALRVARTEGRRRAREYEAHAMMELLDGAEPSADWDRLRPVIDEALQGLGEGEREAVLLRYFEKRPFAEIGRLFAVTEDAARMRVERALEKMRGTLERNGVTSTGAALGAALATQADAAPPSIVIAKIAAAAMAAGSKAAATTLMTLTKLQIGVAGALAVLGAAGLALQHRANARLEARVERLRPLGAENARLREENLTLTKASPPKGGGAAAPAAAPATAPSTRVVADPRQLVPLANGLTPVETLGNVGRASARNTFATQLWAARTGDIALEASTLAFGAEARAKLEAVEASLPEAMRAEYDTPEKLMAFMLAGSPHPVGGMEVLGETDIDANNVVLQTEWQHVDDPVVHQSEISFQQNAEGWKMVVPLPLVNRASAYLIRTLEEGPGK